MANKQLFQTRPGAVLPVAMARNAAQAPAYALDAKHKLAQLAATGCLGGTFYADAAEQLGTVLALTHEVDAAFVARAAVYARERGHMKDMPALLMASLATRNTDLLVKVFPRVIDNGKMLRNFVQIVRSGVVGRKSLGTRPKKLVQRWLCTATEKQLLHAAVGNAPSLADVVKMVHPKPAEAWRAAWFAWLLGKPFDEAALPRITRAFEHYKLNTSRRLVDEVVEVPFQMLTAKAPSPAQWTQIALAGSWQMVRQGLNTFARHGVFAHSDIARAVAKKLADPQALKSARAMPYQLLAAYRAAGPGVPGVVREALNRAMELSLANVPTLKGNVVVCPDVSGSMASSITGFRGSATSSVRCIDVAALLSAAVLRKNPRARVLPFEQRVVEIALNARRTVMANAQALAEIGGGGTDCSAPLALLNKERARVDLVILVSDNQSWVGAHQFSPTRTIQEWEALKLNNPGARLVCIDIQPYGTTQAPERRDILNVGGFSDAVFGLVAAFAAGRMDARHWVGEIENLSLEAH